MSGMWGRDTFGTTTGHAWSTTLCLLSTIKRTKVMSYTHLEIIYDDFPIKYRLRDHPVVSKWIERLTVAQSMYPLDNPERFYGFGNYQDQVDNGLKKINTCIDIINNFELIIDRKLENINDQDTLNYLHHIFEVYHGILDKQDHNFWLRAPKEVRLALADLNVLVHMCESISRGAKPRHVVTYYGLPKTTTLDTEDYKFFTSKIDFGTVYLNYVEIGKTLEDLTMDNDKYIGENAFRPFRHYSADFNVKFFTNTDKQIEENQIKIKNYYYKNRNFFESKGYTYEHPHLTSGSIPLADIEEFNLEYDTILTTLKHKQKVTAVNLI